MAELSVQTYYLLLLVLHMCYILTGRKGDKALDVHYQSNTVQSMPSDSLPGATENKAKAWAQVSVGSSLHYVHSETQARKAERKSTGDKARLVQCPPGKHEALGSISSTT